MLETIANPTNVSKAVVGAPMPTFLSTPRSMMQGSWGACESPRVYDTPTNDKSNNNGLSIQIPTLEDAKPAEPEQRDDAAAGTTNESDSCCASGESAQRNTNLPPASADSPHGRYEADYDKNPTSVFLHLQKKEWEAAAKKADETPLEARTWVSRKEKHGKLRWRLLPIHAAIIFKAPENVVETLLACYPKGAQCKDDQGMLPLHLAFRHGSTEGTVNLLLVAFPESTIIQDRKGRVPLVLAQASASPNRDAFVRALERGPTYYANAAAATERAAVTAEQRAIFDSKLIEVEKRHQQDVNILKEERKGLEESVEMLQKELAKQKGATQVLVDHVNSLEAQLKQKTDTERFLAVKAATIDSELKELKESKQEVELELNEEIEQLKNERGHLQTQLEQLENCQEAENQLSDEEYNHIKQKVDKQEKELKSIKMDWASAQARAAVLEAQLKSKIENEHELASQVSQLAGKLAESAANNGSQSSMYSKRVQVLEEEREKLRATVNDLGKKLLKVSQFMNKMTMKSKDSALKSSEVEKSQRAKLLSDAANHEQLIRTALAEREHMAALLKKQEQEMAKSAKQHQEILEQLSELKKNATHAAAETKEEHDFPFSHSMAEEMNEMMTSVLHGMPAQTNSDDDSDSLVDTVMNNVVVTPKAGSRAQKEVRMFENKYQNDFNTSSSDDEDDPQKCLEDALRALELSRTKSNVEIQKSKDASEEHGQLEGNPSDEESHTVTNRDS